MYARNVTFDQLRQVAIACGFDLKNAETQGNRVRFTLKNNSDRYHSVSRGIFDGGDRTYKSIVCYHGHWVFLELLFETYPDAIVDASRIGVVRYEAATWKREALKLGTVVIREWDQLRPIDKCECGDGWFDGRVDSDDYPS